MSSKIASGRSLGRGQRCFRAFGGLRLGERTSILFYLPQLAHVYYRTLPPLDGDAALRSTLAEEFLLRVARRSFRFALQLAWLLVSYLEDRGRAASRDDRTSCDY